MKQDIILVTIDALRHDATPQMPNIRSQFADGVQAEAITSGSATNWVFPGILSGSYYTRAYNDSGLVRDDWESIADVLGSNGYSTGAFLGFNPYLSKWEDRFDEFWNGDLSSGNGEWYSGPLEKWLSRGYRTALVKKRVPAGAVLDRAEQWYTQQSPPRFLWIHLMEPHGPYYPGLQRVSEIGLLDSYRSIFSFQKHGDETPSHHIETQRQLYNKCVEKVDEDLNKLFEFVDDSAGIALLGDHGEEFEHGHIDHERLYDECVRVPFFSRNLFDDDVPKTVRQIDVPGELLNHARIEVPAAWDGDRFDADPTTFMMSPWQANGTFQCAVRTSQKKYLRTYDRNSGEIVRREFYDLEEDPNELENLYETADTAPLQNQVDEFMRSHRDALGMDPQTGNTSEAVQDRLENLGYK